MTKIPSFFVRVLITFVAIPPITLAQTIPVKSLELDNAFMNRWVGSSMGGNGWDYRLTETVLGDTIINGRTFHRLTGGQFEFSDSVILSSFSGGVEQVICDFRWSVGDTINIAGVPWVVTEKGNGSVFSDPQPYITMRYSEGLSSRRQTYHKRFGRTSWHGESFYSQSDVYILGARINGVIYGSPPTGVEAGRETAEEVSIGVFPNPTIGLVTAHIRLRQPSAAYIQVVNILGQVVYRAFTGLLQKGEQDITWNARTTHGATLPAGVYFVDFQVADRRYIRRLLLIR